MKIKVSASFGGKISSGQYENMYPIFNGEVQFDYPPKDGNEKDFLEMIDSVQKTLHDVAYKNFEAVAQKAKMLKIKNDRSDFRFYELPGGKEAPSVTTIINFQSEFYVDDDDLRLYAAQGNCTHARIEEYIKSMVWKPASDIPGVGADVFMLKTKRLKNGDQLDPDIGDFPSFLKKYELKNMQNGHVVINEENLYAGTFDFVCDYEGVRTLVDVKRTFNKLKNFKQCAAYAKCMDGIEQLMIVVFNDENKQGFSKPIITKDIDKYFELFLADRRDFKKVYGI